MRLIDADALIEAMKKTEDEYEKAMTCPSWGSAYRVIEEQPTAFDADMVYRQMWREAEEVCGNTMIDLEVADEIIRNCGKE